MSGIQEAIDKMQYHIDIIFCRKKYSFVLNKETTLKRENFTSKHKKRQNFHWSIWLEFIIQKNPDADRISVLV